MAKSFSRVLALSSAAFTILAAHGAGAAPVLHYVGADLTAGAYSFSYQGDTFTFAATGDEFNPLAVSTSSAGADNAFGGFLGIPLQPTVEFVDRGPVVLGVDDNYAAFLSLTTVPFSLGQNFIGLRALGNSQDFYGFAYTTNATLNGFGFETTPGASITATTISAAPEPDAWALMILGIGMVGATIRYRKRIVPNGEAELPAIG